MFITENVPIRLRGELTKWMLQLKPGVFIGTLSTLVGEKLWIKIQEKIDNGGAIWVKATNNEQKFEVQSCGEINWSLRDFDGLQLISHPNKKKKSTLGQSINKKKEIKRTIPRKTIPPVTWDTEGTPDNLLIRKAKFTFLESNLIFELNGSSAYGEYPPDKLWSDPWLIELKKYSRSLLNWVSNKKNTCTNLLEERTLMSLDIETTDYLPKAREGFINIIGLVLLNLKESSPVLQFYQVFNMTRKKSNVPLMLELITSHFHKIDLLLVFNQEFDIQILNQVIKEFSLKASLPSHIVDLRNWFSSLAQLEDFLTKQVNIERSQTKKTEFSKYYKLFKGKGKIGLDKKIEPLGTYNLIDTLTPLYAYLLISSDNNYLGKTK
ncbi:MAG: type I-E CRISPR-associated endoribonuclease Cas2 [Candidatus Helarchaeota archaeon]|nr:type I-E CRISPR-associated endoribonuclease Cas2 [Candidatus Helarchaeota archaeon]